MRAYKEGKYLIFRFDDGKDVRYDLATGETIGKSGKLVKSIASQLRGYDIPSTIDSFEDENYMEFLRYIDNNFINNSTSRNNRYRRREYNRVNKIQNLGSFLSRISQYSVFEQYFACGLRKIDPKMRTPINSIPKGLIALCKRHNIELSEIIIEKYRENHNDFHKILSIDFMSINKIDVVLCLIGLERTLGDTHFSKLTSEYGYKQISLLQYVDKLLTYEALEGIWHTIREIADYARMMSQISPKYDKYPKNFLTTHRIASRNYARLRATFEEEKFIKRIDKRLEFKSSGFVVIYPTSTQEIKDEAVQQNNCVASYIQNVINGECHILFMRDEKSDEKSLITLEVVGNKVIQAKGRYNRETTDQEQAFIDKYNKQLQKIKAEGLQNAS